MEIFSYGILLTLNATALRINQESETDGHGVNGSKPGDCHAKEQESTVPGQHKHTAVPEENLENQEGEGSSTPHTVHSTALTKRIKVLDELHGGRPRKVADDVWSHRQIEGFSMA